MQKRIIQAFLMPAFVLIIQLFFKFLFDTEILGVGISLASVALAQIFPYLFFDNLILLKVFSLSTKFDESKNVLKTTYSFTIKKNSEQIQGLRNLTVALFIIILTLFILTLGLSFKEGYYEYHNYSGILSVLFSIGYLILA